MKLFEDAFNTYANIYSVSEEGTLTRALEKDFSDDELHINERIESEYFQELRNE